MSMEKPPIIGDFVSYIFCDLEGNSDTDCVVRAGVVPMAEERRDGWGGGGEDGTDFRGILEKGKLLRSFLDCPKMPSLPVSTERTDTVKTILQPLTTEYIKLGLRFGISWPVPSR